MYKYQLQGKKEENKNIGYTMLHEIKENEVLKVPENQEQQQEPQTPASVIRSTRLSTPPEQFFPSLFYLLMTHSGEPECYEEAM